MSWTPFVFKSSPAGSTVPEFFNARSERTKSAVLMEYLCDCKADLYAAMETWLQEDDAAVRAELNLDGYNFLYLVLLDWVQRLTQLAMEFYWIASVRALELGHRHCMQWFTSCPLNRLQCVSFDHNLSEKLNLQCGVPQRSCLGPLLFTIYASKLF